MQKLKTNFWIISFGLIFFAVDLSVAGDQMYSDLTEKTCKMTKQAAEGEGDWVVLRCLGVLGYDLEKEYDDQRESLTLLRGTERHDLNFYDHLVGSFHHLGEKAEWRLKDGKPVALIVPAIVTQEDKTQMHYLIVVSIRPKHSCVVQVINASKEGNANAKAQQSADHAMGLGCLTPS